MSTSQNSIPSLHKLATKQTTPKRSRSSLVDFQRPSMKRYTSWMTQRRTKHGDEPPSSDKKNGCTCSPSNKEGRRSIAFDKQVGHEMLTLTGFSHPHPGIQMQWTPRPGPGSMVVSRSLTTPRNTRKTQNHCSNLGRGTIARNKSTEEEEACLR
jgi:hypothetical protein